MKKLPRMGQMLSLIDNSDSLQWHTVSSFLPDPERLRVYDGILDFGCWRTELNALDLISAMAAYGPKVEALSVVVAGKHSGPDPDAMQMASSVLGRLVEALRPLRERYPDFPISNDEWMLNTIWFPYQTRGPCWFAAFDTEYDGLAQFCFQRRPDGGWSVDQLLGTGNGLVEGVFLARECIERLNRPEVSDEGFDRILLRIQEERLVGPELIDALSSVVAKEVVGLPAWELEHLGGCFERYREVNT
ncbi:hypothetical protein [Silvimonas iriomotensis]|uniref:hypothetical protein n=1 Tax=Silvimonas iriomotensis TaxID=449662 RepID=UPI00166B0EC7|nr:hypothetical protein [Silvimonas iriomotensis]